MKPEHTKTLVLNVNFVPLGLIRWERAIKLLVKKHARIVEYFENDYIIGVSKKYPIPGIISTHKEVKRKKAIPFNRKNVFIRDRLICQYCRKRFPPQQLTYDHVIPRDQWDNDKRGTPTKWTNIVTCCKPCNHRKDNRTPEQAGMVLKKQPQMPPSFGFVLGLSPWGTIPSIWLDYLPPLYREIYRTSHA